MCFPNVSKIEGSSEDVFDLLINEPDRAEIEIALRLENALFQLPETLIAIQEQNQQMVPAENTNLISNNPIIHMETLINTHETNIESFLEDSVEEFEIQAFFRQAY